jgi:hypothetical protein
VDKVQGKKALLSGPSGQGNPGMGVQDIRGVCLWIYHGILTPHGWGGFPYSQKSKVFCYPIYYAGLSFPWSKMVPRPWLSFCIWKSE